MSELKKMQKALGPVVAAQASELLTILGQCPAVGPAVSEPIKKVPLGVVYEQHMSDDDDPLAFFQEVAAARYYQINMLKRDILRREKRNIGLRADAEVKRLDLQFKLDVERDLEAHLPNGPDGAISHDVSSVMLETLKQNVEGLEALFKVREKRLKFKIDQFHAMNRNPDVAHIMCMKAEALKLEKKVATVTEKTLALERIAKNIKLKLVDLLKMWDENMRETCDSLRAAKALMAKIFREGTENESDFYEEAVALLTEAGVEHPIRTLREDSMLCLKNFVEGMERLKEINEKYADIPAWTAEV